MLSFRKTFASVALAAAAVMAGPGIAAASDHSERGEGPALYGQCNDFTTQLGAVNLNQGPVCIDFGSSGEADENTGGDDGMGFNCNAGVTQVGLINLNQGPVCIRF
jgi:hypothetical protein